MKIDFKDVDLENFIIKDGLFCGIPAKLVCPQHIGCHWTQDNKNFRSSIWSEDGELLSAGFPKFPNLGENPEVFPVPTSLDGATIIDKMDGSLCIVDMVNNKLSMRTRGTFTYETMQNAEDFKGCQEKYPKISDWMKSHPNITLMFEITTPNLRIVLNYGDVPDLTLIGGIRKGDYTLISQDVLDIISDDIAVKRPVKYTADSVDELIDVMKGMKGIEGCVLYTQNDQVLHKIKSIEYINLHYLKSSLGETKLVDLIESLDYMFFPMFKKYITDKFDHECWKSIEKRTKEIYGLYDLYVDGFQWSFNVLLSIMENNEWTIKDNRGDIARFMNTGWINPNIAFEHRESIDNTFKDLCGDYIPLIFMKLDDKFDWKSDKTRRWMKNMIIKGLDA
jgi:hypothetical protein